MVIKITPEEHIFSLLSIDTNTVKIMIIPFVIDYGAISKFDGNIDKSNLALEFYFFDFKDNLKVLTFESKAENDNTGLPEMNWEILTQSELNEYGRKYEVKWFDNFLSARNKIGNDGLFYYKTD